VDNRRTEVKTLLFIVFVALCLLAAIAQPQNQTPISFVGAKACAACHDSGVEGESSFQVWQASGHSQAFRTLVACTENQARDLGDLKLWVVTMGNGERYGLPNPAQESRHCLPCHATGLGVDAKLLGTSFDMKDGIQCESCHGPGSAHVEAKTADKSMEAAVPFKRYKDENAIKAKCSSCHDGTCGEFDFATAWPKVKHSAH
jgi:hypothetical protein